MTSGVRVAVLLVATAMFVQACGEETNSEPSVRSPATTQNAEVPLASPSGPEVRSAQLLSKSDGWALTGMELARTADGGATWTDITPGGVSPDAISGVFFLDVDRGWLVAGRAADTTGAIALTVFRSEDGGLTWLASDLGAPEPTYSGGAVIDFVDGLNGWVMVRLVSGSNFSFGALFYTADGGATWREMPTPPLGDPVEFVNSSEGWIAGGPAGDKLFVTHDGGQTWGPVLVAQPEQSSSSQPRFALPGFWNHEDGVLPVTFPGESSTTISFYLTRDAGVSWTMASSMQNARGPTSLAAILDSDTWVVVSSVGTVTITDDGGTRWKSPPPEALPANFGAITELHFIDGGTGWVRTNLSGCRSFKSDCFSGNELFSTGDGGQSWTQLLP